MRSAWKLKSADQKLKGDISQELRVSATLATLLINRGVGDIESAERFLNPRLQHVYDPFLLKDSDKAVDRILKALSLGKRIVVYGDGDVDGITGTVIVFETLRDLGAKVSSHILERAKEKPGLKKAFIDKISQEGVKLIITVDCGIYNYAEVAYADSLGIDVIITDHHEPLGNLPQALAVVNPKREDCPYPFKSLAGAAVAYKIAQGAATRQLGISASQWHSVKADLLCPLLIGTVADRVELLQENRVFAKLGLEAFSRTARPWIQAIAEVTGVDLGNLTIPLLLRSFIPVLSSGRSQDNRNSAYELLLTDRIDQAQQLTSELYESSQDWHRMAREAYNGIRDRAGDLYSSRIIIVADEECAPDFIGYCASRLKEQFSRPTVVIGFKGDYAIGEARAPLEFDLIACLRGCDDLLLDYGGHKAAAGFSMDPEKMGELSLRLEDYAEQKLDQDKLHPVLEIDAELPLGELDTGIIEEIKRLAPFGEGNPEPLFLNKGVYVEKIQDGYRVLDYDLLLLEDRRTRCDWLYPHAGPAPWVVSHPTGPAKLDIVYLVDPSGRLFLRDCRPSES